MSPETKLSSLRRKSDKFVVLLIDDVSRVGRDRSRWRKMCTIAYTFDAYCVISISDNR